MPTVYNFRTPHELEEQIQHSFTVQIPTHAPETTITQFLDYFKIHFLSIVPNHLLDVNQDEVAFEQLFHKMSIQYLSCTNEDEQYQVYNDIVATPGSEDALTKAMHIPSFTFDHFCTMMHGVLITGIDPRENPPAKEQLKGYRIICSCQEFEQLLERIHMGTFSGDTPTSFVENMADQAIQQTHIIGLKKGKNGFDIDEIHFSKTDYFFTKHFSSNLCCPSSS
jgi:hypothetical protein